MSKVNDNRIEMVPTFSANSLVGRVARCAIGLVLTVGIIAGCSHITQRGQSPDAEAMEFADDFNKPVYVGDIAGPIGLDKLKVDGIALVTQLDGTGSEPNASEQRNLLIEEIKTHEVQDITGLLASKDNSMAIVSGVVPPGARKGDRFDISVQAMRRSKTTSLEGGYVMRARMKPYLQTNRDLSFGHDWAVSKGRVVVESLFESGDKEVKSLRGMIPGGGMVTRDRECGIQIVETEKSIKNTTSIAHAINARFSARVLGRPEGVAEPKDDRSIVVLIPEGYRHNVGRYFHVLLNIVFSETADQRVNRMERLERELHDPDKSSLTAIRLEAIGEDAINILKRGLRSKDFEVQFQSAQALAYMSDESGVAILRKAADIEPAFRWHALTALACLKNSSSEDALASLFNSASSEARYGAFQSLRDSMPDSNVIAGEFLGREFMLHTVPCTSKPIVHISRTRVPEVVLFGGDQRFNQNLLFLRSGLTVKSEGSSRVMIKKYLPGGEEQKIVCSNLVTDVIRQMVNLGSDYGDIILLLKDARQTESMNSRLVINTLPKLSDSYQRHATTVTANGDSDRYVSDRGEETANTGSGINQDAGRMGSGKSGGKGKGVFGKLW